MREVKKGLIMKSALELFANQGFRGTSIHDITKNAGISKGLLYNYFTNKEEPIIEIILKGFNELLRVFNPKKDGILTRQEMSTSSVKYSSLWKAIFITGDCIFRF